MIAPGKRNAAVSLWPIGLKFRTHRLVHGNLAVPVALGFTEGQYATIQVDIGSGQLDGFSNAQTGGGQKTEEGSVGDRTQPAGGRQMLGCCQ